MKAKNPAPLISRTRYFIYEAFQGANATNDTALKTGDMRLSKHRQASQLSRQNTTAIQ